MKHRWVGKWCLHKLTLDKLDKCGQVPCHECAKKHPDEAPVRVTPICKLCGCYEDERGDPCGGGLVSDAD